MAKVITPPKKKTNRFKSRSDPRWPPRSASPSLAVAAGGSGAGVPILERGGDVRDLGERRTGVVGVLGGWARTRTSTTTPPSRRSSAPASAHAGKVDAQAPHNHGRRPRSPLPAGGQSLEVKKLDRQPLIPPLLQEAPERSSLLY